MRRDRSITWLARLVLVVPVALLAWAVMSELLAAEAAAPAPEAAEAEAQEVPRGVSPDAPRAATEGAAAQEGRRAETLTPPAPPPPAPEPEPPPIEDEAPDPTFLEKYTPDWSRYRVLDIAVWQFAAAFGFILVGLVLRKVSDYVIRKHVLPLLERTRVEFDNLVVQAVSKPLGWLLLLAGVALAVWVLRLPTEPTNVKRFAFGVLKVLLVADLLWFLFRFVDVIAIYLAHLAGRTDSSLDDQLVPLVRKALKVTVALLMGVWVVQLLGYSITSLLAGLGVGGLAVALALQDTLANFFGSVFIFMDRPFMVGDMVEIEGTQGTVEQIGFRSTRIRTWPATLVSIPNKTVASTKIDNWSKMPKRRVFQTVGVTYETSADQMQEAVAAIRAILENDDGVDQDYIVVRFTEFGASSLDILVYYFTRSVAYDEHLATKERVNLAIMRALRGMGLSIAFPTQTVYFEGDVAERLAGRGGDGKDGGNTVNHS
ncbi:MAG: mechanosensitive ion channel family protein [Phycisphaerae bacterium]